MELEIEKLDYEGKGITRKDHKIIFIPRTLPNETIEASIVKEKRNYSIGKCQKVLKKSKLRLESYCPYASQCGGCSYDIVSYKDSLKIKKNAIQELFQKNGISIDDVQIEESKPSLGYRNKISLKVQNYQFGYYESESHIMIFIDNCKLASPPIQSFLKDFSMLNLKEGEIILRSNDNEELLIVITSKEQPKIREEIIKNHKIAGIVWNKKCIYNAPFFIEKRGDFLYKVRYSSFFQVNSNISERIKRELLESFSPSDEVLDLYCGVGFFSLPLAKKVKKVIGVEYNPLSIVDAIYNASLNKIENTTFHAGKVEEILENIPNKANKVVVDPPRAGLDKKVREILKKKKYELIYYISCNPFTLTRDLKELENTYKIKQIKLYDMFPFTSHVESVAVLERR
ncbi:MAG: class I SAM-dependent RNA methyltransferase [Bacilli bacterium]|nr:class I SAM-dependent RNA methyltransferase [Bacilli bacterium]